MRTALLTFDYPPAPSGLSVAAREIAHALADEGVDVTVFTLDRDGTAEAEGVRVVGRRIGEASLLGRVRRFGALGHLAAPLAFRRLVLAAHREQPFDLVEATNWYAPAALLVGVENLPVVTRNSTPAMFSREPADGVRDALDGWAADLLERRQARASAALVSNTAEHAERMADAYGLDPAAAPHAVIGLSLPPATVARGARAPYPPEPASGEPVRLLFVGRAEPRKGFDTILEALAILAFERAAGALPPFELALMGVPPEDLPTDLLPDVEAILRPLGRRPEAELALAYERAHAVLAPSRYESFGLVYQEALAFGRPVVASALDASARRFVGAPGAGLLADRQDGAALAVALRRIICEPQLRLELRGRALEAAGLFTRQTLGRETLSLYRRALARSSP